MSEPAILRWPVPGRIAVEGAVMACPMCGQTERLVLTMDLDDRSDDPAYLGCPRGHMWAEQRFPRRLAAQFLDEVLQIEPALLGYLKDLREIQADDDL